MFGEHGCWLEDIIDMIEDYISMFFDFIFCKGARSYNSDEPKNTISSPIHSPTFEADQVYPCKENF